MPGAGTTKAKKTVKSAREGRAGKSRLERECADLRNRNAALDLRCRMLREIERVTARRFKLEPFLERLMDLVIKATGSESGTIFLLDDFDGSLEFSVVRGPVAGRLKGRRIPSEEGIVGRVVKSGKPHISNRVRLDPDWSPRVAKQVKHRTWNILAVPLKMGGKVRGAIELINKKDGRPFVREDQTLLRALAAEASVAIENARLLTEANRMAEHFETLCRLGAILNSALDKNTVRKRAMEAVVELLECETGSLYLIDEEKQELYFEVALGEKGEAVKEVRLKIGEGIAGWVAKEGKPDLVPDTGRDPRWASRVDRKSKFKTRNMVTVPIRARGAVIGVLQAINKLDNMKFDRADQKLLENLADQVSIALENARLYEELRETFKETAEALASAIEKRDPYTGGHTKRVRDLSLAAAGHMKVDPHDREWLEIAAILHDVGKIGVPDHILRKPDRLSDREFERMKAHTLYGHDILKHVKQLEPTIPGMKYHHERFDGRGYPEGLKGRRIPMIARIIAVADSWDAMTSDRPYRTGMPDRSALAELKRCSGVQFDPEVVKAFVRAHSKGEVVSHRGVRKAGARTRAGQRQKPRGVLDDG